MNLEGFFPHKQFRSRFNVLLFLLYLLYFLEEHVELTCCFWKSMSTPPHSITLYFVLSDTLFSNTFGKALESWGMVSSFEDMVKFAMILGNHVGPRLRKGWIWGKGLGSGMHEAQALEASKWSRSVVSDSLRPRGLQPTKLLCPWDSSGKSTGVGCHCLLQEFTFVTPNWAN